MNNLLQYGWNEELFSQKQHSNYKELEHGRVTVTHKTCYEVVSEKGMFTCELSGNMLFGREQADYPCTGDWIIFQPIDADKGIIVDMLPRQKALYRLKTGSVSEKQALASHIDKALVVQSLDGFFNVRRIERFLVQITHEGIQPALVLTKTDLGFDENRVQNELKHLANKVQVFYTSTQQPESIEKLRAFIKPGETVVFTGMSGAGKSTLINMLCGHEFLQTSEISSATGKGRHTTTRREMVLLEGSGILIDTPGVKLLGMTNDEEGSLSEVLNIDRYEGKCRFSNCQHMNEKGCAVIEAVENGEIEREVYESFLKLRREAWHYTASVHEKRQFERSFSKMVKEVKKHSKLDD